MMAYKNLYSLRDTLQNYERYQSDTIILILLYLICGWLGWIHIFNHSSMLTTLKLMGCQIDK